MTHNMFKLTDKGKIQVYAPTVYSTSYMYALENTNNKQIR